MASIGVSGPGWILADTLIGTIAEVKDINGPAQIADKDEITNQSSPSAYKEWIVTLLDGGAVTFDCVYVPGDASQGSVSGMLSFLQARGKRSFTITPPSPYTANVIAFDALVTKWAPVMAVGKHATIAIELYVTGPIVVS
jgi:hypothetical protein